MTLSPANPVTWIMSPHCLVCSVTCTRHSRCLWDYENPRGNARPSCHTCSCHFLSPGLLPQVPGHVRGAQRAGTCAEQKTLLRLIDHDSCLGNYILKLLANAFGLQSLEGARVSDSDHCQRPCSIPTSVFFPLHEAFLPNNKNISTGSCEKSCS